MNMHKIVDLAVDMGYFYPRLANQALAYKTDEKLRPNMTIYLSQQYLERCQKENPHLSLEQCEYIWTGAIFYDALVNFDGFMLHSSAVIMDGKAYLFSAPSGTGKSTHTGLWLEHFGDRAKILNDDKPAIRITDSGIRVYGTPWSGKTALNINTDAELAGICFIERDTTNHIEEISKAEAVIKVMNQTMRPAGEKEMDMLLATLDKVISQTPVYKMGCNISDEAVVVAYEAMSGKKA